MAETDLRAAQSSGSLEVTSSDSDMNTGGNELFIFTHVPKTAGSTFKDLLDQQFAKGRIHRIGPDYQRGVEMLRSASDSDKAGVQCILGHIPFGMHQFFGPRVLKYISFVRDPVGRALSEYQFFARQPQLMPLMGLEPGTKLTPEAFFEHQTSIGMHDLQSRILSGYGNMVESVLPPYPKMEVSDSDGFISDIINNYAMIGTQERFDESLLLMKEEFGWGSMRYVRRNVAPPSEEKKRLKQAFSEQLRELNPLDSLLFKRVSERVDAAIAQRGDAFQSELQSYRKANLWYSRGWAICRATGLRRLYRLFGGR